MIRSFFQIFTMQSPWVRDSPSIYCGNAFLFVMSEDKEKRCTKHIEFVKMLSLKLHIFFFKKRKIKKILRFINDPLSGPPIPEVPFMPSNLVTLLAVIQGDNTQCIFMTEWKIDSEMEIFLNEKYTSIKGCGEIIYFSNKERNECFGQFMEEMEVELPNDICINSKLKELWAVPPSQDVCCKIAVKRQKQNKKISSIRQGDELEGTSHLQPGGYPIPYKGFFC